MDPGSWTLDGETVWLVAIVLAFIVAIINND